MNDKQGNLNLRLDWRKLCLSSIACLLMLTMGQTGCAGSQLTPEEQTRYDQLIGERDQIASERAELARQVNADFSKSGRLEEKHKAMAKDLTLSCGYAVSKSSFGPLPFKKKKGKQATFGSAKSASRSGCKRHSLRVK